MPTLEKAVGNYKRKTGDERVEFVKLPDTQEGEFGSRQHPGTDLMKEQRNPGGEDSGKNDAAGHAVTSNTRLIKK